MAQQKPRLKVVPISTKHPSGDTWSPLQLLKEFVSDVEAGNLRPVKLVLHFFEETPDGGLQPRSWQAGCTRTEEIALMELEMHRAIEAWRK